MPNPQIADLIKNNLGQLVYPGKDNSPSIVLPLPMFRNNNLHPEQAKYFAKEAGFPSADVAGLVAEAIVHLIETEGDSEIVPKSQLRQLSTASQAGTERHRRIRLNCTLCGNPIIAQMNVDTQNPSINGPYFLELMQKINPACPHGLKDA